MTRANGACSIALVVGAWGAAVCVAPGRAETTAAEIGPMRTRVVAPQGVPADAIDTVKPPALSEDGRLIAFVSRNRRSSPQSCCQHVYVVDRSTGLTTRESVALDGTAADGDSQGPSISSDGWMIAFETVATNLVPGRTQVGQAHVVVRVRPDGRTRSPQGLDASAPDGETRQPVVSGNGRVLVFTSDADNLVPGPDANGRQTDIYLWRVDDAPITRVSVDSNGTQPPDGASHSPSVSREGELVAFVSTARLAPEDVNDVSDVYLRDVRRGLTTLVSRAVGGGSADGPAYAPALSADGAHLAFVSSASNLAASGSKRESGVYIYDVADATIARVSASAKGAPANAASGRPAISADGRYVAYQSLASNLGSGPGCPPVDSDTNLLPDVYLFDRATGCVVRISGFAGREWWTPSVAPAIDAAGSVVLFSSTQPAREDDLSTDFDLFLFQRLTSQASMARSRRPSASNSKCCP